MKFDFCESGKDVYIHESVIFRRPSLVKLGNHIAIDAYSIFTTGLETGDHIHVSYHVKVIGGENGLLKLGDFCNLSAGATIVCGSEKFHGDGLIRAPGIPEDLCDVLNTNPVVFADFVNTGANVTVLPGVNVPEGVVLGANSLVRSTDQLDPWTIYAGNPIRPLRSRNRDNMLSSAQKLRSNPTDGT